MNHLDVSTPEDVRAALIEGEFKRLVKYDAGLGENEKRHILASASDVIKLAERSMQTALYDLPPLPVDMYTMTIVSSLFGSVFSYVFADEEHAVSSARWYAAYAGWVKPADKEGKERGSAIEHQGGEMFVLRIVDSRSGDFVIINKARVNFSSISPRVEST